MNFWSGREIPVFIGHIAVGLASKGAARKPSLGTYLAAVQFADLLWPIFLLLGLEKVAIAPGATAVTPLNFVSYPISHSLLADVGWALVFAGVYFILRKDSRGAILLGICVLSHWLLDAISHRPDMPLFPGGGPLVGLGLWNSVPATMLVEVSMLALGLLIYVRATEARDRTGSYAFWSFIVLLLIIYLANIFGPPPPSARALAIVGLAAWGFLPWAYWIDRHRTVRSPANNKRE
jgi:hypothetical protein